MKQRDDIQALRAVSVIAVIACHSGILANGFLGVDIFFTISGFIISAKIIDDIQHDRFTLFSFYSRRIRRILPLSLFASGIALLIGVVTMLPDDLENLAQSVVATNVMANNYLQFITTRDYWNIANEFKPLMHTWSLGVEEQFYLVFPVIFWIGFCKYKKAVTAVIVLLAAISILLFLNPSASSAEKFYLLPFRFWELSAGCVAALATRTGLMRPRFILIPLVVIFAILLSVSPTRSPSLQLIAIVLASTYFLACDNDLVVSGSKFAAIMKPLVYIGKISFGLYIWHQIVFSFTRYTIAPTLNLTQCAVCTLVTATLAVATFYLIEERFRDRKRTPKVALVLFLSSLWLTTSTFSLWLFLNAGVIRDVPELGITTKSTKRGMHSEYNDRVYAFDKDFAFPSKKTHVLVLGNSFARDWVNVLLESRFANQIEVSYAFPKDLSAELRNRLATADVIFYSAPSESQLSELSDFERKIWVVGTKNFGGSNGVFYNYRGDNRFSQRTSIVPDVLTAYKSQFLLSPDRYIDIIAKTIDGQGTVPVFTPDKHFISPDCTHFTEFGAKYFAQLFDTELGTILSSQQEVL